MHNTTHLRRLCPLFVFSILAALILALPARAQSSSTGSIQGRIYNPVLKEYVKNAEVRLTGTNSVAFTEGDGTFQFANVPAGPATVVVNYTGYNTVNEIFTVTAGAATVREINLVSTSAAATAEKDGVTKLQAFTVETEREGNAKAIMAQRRNMNITTSVSSDIFGDVADGNVGEFLKYLPGVDLDYVESEARGPRLGGMEGQYVGVSFDGMRSASADANRGGGTASRATSFEGFSITSIDSIEISRTTSAESDADSPAGTVNMKTKRAYERKGQHFGYNVGANFNAEEFTLGRTPGPRDHSDYKWRPNYQVDYSESFFNQRFGILLSANRADSYTEQYDVNVGYNRTPEVTAPAGVTRPADTRPLVIRQIDFKDGPKFIHKDSLLLTADWKATPHLVLSLNMIYSYFEGEFWNRNFTFIAANDNSNVGNGRATVGGDGVLDVRTNRVVGTNTVPTINNGGGTSSKLTYTRQFSPRFEYKLGAWVIDGAMALSRAVNNYESLERGFSQSEGGGVPSDWTATRANPQSWEWTIRQTSGPDWYDPRSFVNTDNRAGGTRVNNDDRTWVTEKWTGVLNSQVALPFSRLPIVLKFGVKWDEEARKNGDRGAWNTWSYNGPGGNTTTVNPLTGANIISTFGNWANVGPGYTSAHPFDLGTSNALTIFNINGVQGMPPRVSRNAISELFHQRPDLFVHTGTPENYYTSFIANARDFKQTLNSAFGQADLRIGPKLRVRLGLRVEETRNELTEFDPLTRAQVIAGGFPVYATTTNSGRATTIAGLQYQYMSQPRIVRESKYDNWFPSLLIKYQILTNLELQAGFNKAISRPPIDSLTGLFVVDETNFRVNAPNAKLEPEFHKNYQVRLAYYFGNKSPGQLSLALSQNDATNFRQTFDFSASEFGIDDPDFASYTFRTTINSTEEQRFRNMDLAYNQTLGMLPSKYLRGISVGANYSRSYANQRRQNLAPHRVSSRLGYSYSRFNGSFAMVWRDASPDSGTYGRIKGELTQFDLTLNWRLNRWASIYVQGRNITNVPVIWYESPPGVEEGKQRALRDYQEYGANWVFGVKGQF